MKTSRELLDVQTMLGSPSWRFFASFVEERRQANATGAKSPIVDLASLFPRERLLGAEEVCEIGILPAAGCGASRLGLNAVLVDRLER